MQISEVKTRTELQQYLSQPWEVLKSDNFAQVVSKALSVGLTEVQLGDAIDVSEYTVKRWASRVTAPHEVMQRVAYEKWHELISTSPAS